MQERRLEITPTGRGHMILWDGEEPREVTELRPRTRWKGQPLGDRVAGLSDLTADKARDLGRHIWQQASQHQPLDANTLVVLTAHDVETLALPWQLAATPENWLA